MAQRLTDAKALAELQRRWDADRRVREVWQRDEELLRWWMTNQTDWDREFLRDGQANCKISPQ